MPDIASPCLLHAEHPALHHPSLSIPGTWPPSSVALSNTTERPVASHKTNKLIVAPVLFVRDCVTLKAPSLLSSTYPCLPREEGLRGVRKTRCKLFEAFPSCNATMDAGM